MEITERYETLLAAEREKNSEIVRKIYEEQSADV
jgi:hypothetical protein